MRKARRTGRLDAADPTGPAASGPSYKGLASDGRRRSLRECYAWPAEFPT
ncbi:hypothetical protein [Azospirillum endophyticum]